MGEGERPEGAPRETHQTEEMKTFAQQPLPGVLSGGSGRGRGEAQVRKQPRRSATQEMFSSSTHPGVQLDKGHREGARRAQRQASQRWLGTRELGFLLFIFQQKLLSIYKVPGGRLCLLVQEGAGTAPCPEGGHGGTGHRKVQMLVVERERM